MPQDPQVAATNATPPPPRRLHRRASRRVRRISQRFNRYQRQQGFTLIELLTVVGIIGILLAIGTVAMSAVSRQAERRRTRMLLKACEALNTEYKAQTGSWVNADDTSTTPVDWSIPIAKTACTNCGKGIPDARIERFVTAVFQLPQTENFLQSGDLKDLVYDQDNDGFLEIHDPWKNPVDYVTTTTGGDIRQNQSPYFVSPGPDGKLGTYTAQNEPDADADDNIYSLDLE